MKRYNVKVITIINGIKSIVIDDVIYLTKNELDVVINIINIYRQAVYKLQNALEQSTVVDITIDEVEKSDDFARFARKVQDMTINIIDDYNKSLDGSESLYSIINEYCQSKQQ